MSHAILWMPVFAIRVYYWQPTFSLQFIRYTVVQTLQLAAHMRRSV
jgi:hypothetical protein